jgi:hypothetical protein
MIRSSSRRAEPAEGAPGPKMMETTQPIPENSNFGTPVELMSKTAQTFDITSRQITLAGWPRSVAVDGCVGMQGRRCSVHLGRFVIVAPSQMIALFLIHFERHPMTLSPLASTGCCRLLIGLGSSLHAPEATPSTEAPVVVESGPVKFTEQCLLHGHTYAYGLAAHDVDADGDLDLTSADAETNSNVYLLLNDGHGAFKHSLIQKHDPDDPTDPIRLERHALGDVNGDGRPDLVVVDNLQWDIRWNENPGPQAITGRWPLHRVAEPKEVPGSYDVSLADLDGDGDLDVAASSWRFGNRFDWFENVGAPGNGGKWQRHDVDRDIGETRTIEAADFSGDGRPDLLGTSRTGNLIAWYENTGPAATPTWKKHVIDDQTQAPTHGHASDIDGDGDLDVLMAFGLASGAAGDAGSSHLVAWYENVGRPGTAAKWQKHLIATEFSNGFEAVAGDLDGDGDQDVVATGWTADGQIVWFENSGDPAGQWERHNLKHPWTNAVTVVVCDLNGDSRLDQHQLRPSRLTTKKSAGGT